MALSPCFSILAPYQPFRPKSWHVLLKFSSRDEMEVKKVKAGDLEEKRKRAKVGLIMDN
jgi:hypothetical protein